MLVPFIAPWPCVSQTLPLVACIWEGYVSNLGFYTDHSVYVPSWVFSVLPNVCRNDVIRYAAATSFPIPYKLAGKWHVFRHSTLDND
jgi:hypothetical protein